MCYRHNGHDVLLGGAGADTLDGGAGDDVFVDGAGNDFVTGGAGNDSFMTSAGNDAYAGGEGFDTLSFAGGLDGGMFIDMSTGVARAFGSGIGNGTGTDSFSGVEAIVGSRGGDRINGDAGNNRIDGSYGADLIVGGAGSDTLTGGSYDSDIFMYRMSDVANGEIDTITDFEYGDLVEVSAIVDGRDGSQVLSLQDDGYSTTLYADINGQSVGIVVFQGYSGHTLEEMINDYMLVF